MIETVEILDPKTRGLVGTISVNGGPPELTTSVKSIKEYFSENLPDILAGGNRVNGLVGGDSFCYERVFSPGQPGYWSAIRWVVGDYLLRDPKTGEVF